MTGNREDKKGAGAPVRDELGSADGHSGQTSCPDPAGAIPSADFFGRWRLYADRLYRDTKTRGEFEREYGDWYRSAFGVEPDMQRAMLNLFPLWAVYRLGREDAA